MNKNVKRIVAMALAIGTVSAIAPATNINLLTTKVYAADDENDDEELESLELKTSSDATIKLYDDDDYDNRVDEDDVDDKGIYYARTSSKTIHISIDGPSSKYVKVFKGTSKSTKGKSITSDIDLSSGTNTLVVRVYSSKPSSDVEYEDDDDVTSEYKLKIKYTGSTSDSDDEDNADDYDDIYLKKLSVGGQSISLSKSKVNYSYTVASDVDEVSIKAEPEDEDYTVTIDDEEVDDDDNYKTSVDLDKGVNEIEIVIENEDDDEERVYTLKITRGSTTSTGTSTGTNTTTTPSTATNVSTVKANQWVLVNGKWIYNDSTGNPIKNSWFADRNYGKTYYLQADGTMATGWLNNGGKWYYLGADGAMRTGWILDGGKYYYLYADGTMAYNTTINGYKLGSSGAWVK